MSGEKIQKSLSSIVEQIKQKISIIDIIGQDVLLRKVGKNYSGLCPFHSERTPSFTVNEEKGLYHCYGCKAGGDLISYVTQSHGLSFPDAVEFLADKSGLISEFKKVHTSTPGGAQAAHKMKTAYKLNRFVSFYYKENLYRNEKVKSYLSSRGVSAESMRNFYIGFAEESWDQLCRYLNEKKAPLELGFELGLFQKSKKKQDSQTLPYFDTFRNRVVFPILDTKGHVIGFGGRLIPGGESSESVSQPKYMNSPESFLFKKNQELFGVYQSKKHIREQNSAIVVEGFFDVIGMHEAQMPNVVATCGTALSLSHIKQLNRFCEKTIIAFDGDEAGQSALIKAMELGLQNGIILYGVFLPQGRDPHDLSQSEDGRVLLKKLISEASPILDSFIEKDLNREGGFSEEEKNKSLKRIFTWLNFYQDQIGKELRVNRISELTGIGKSALMRELKMSYGGGGLHATPFVSRQSRPQGKIAMRQKIPSVKKPIEAWEWSLLQSQLHHKVLDLLWDEVRTYFPREMTKIDIFSSQLPKKLTLIAEKLSLDGSKNSLNFEAWEAQVLQEFEVEKQPQVLSIIRELLLTTVGVSSESQVRGSFQIGLMKLWARFSQTLKLALRDSESRVDLPTHSQLMKEYLDVQRKMKECINFYVNDQGN